MEYTVLISAFLFGACSQVLQLFQLLKNLKILDRKKNVTASLTVGVSVVIAARNEGKLLKRLLESLLKQNYPDYEIVIVLDRCADNSKEVVNRINNPKIQVIEIEQLPLHWNGKKYALTQGILSAQFPWILLTDADCLPSSEHWIKEMSKGMQPKKDLVLGIGAYNTHKSLLNDLIQYETLLTASRYLSASLPYMGVGRNIGYRKSAFEKIGGFEKIKSITGGDDDLLVQLLATESNTQVIFGENSLTYSNPKRTWKEYLVQKTRHFSVGKHYKPLFKWKLTFWSITETSFWVSFFILVTFNLTGSIAAGILLLFVVIKGLILRTTAKRLGITWTITSHILIDFIYAIGLPLWSLRSLLIKNIRWN